MADRNLRAYYYVFQPTGSDAIDTILEQVAAAGKAHHHTSEWSDAPAYDGGPSFIERIQKAANDAAKTVKPKFEETFCSQCGESFGPGDSGYSHCKDHLSQ